MAKDLGTVVSKWTASASAAQASYVQGVETTTKDPTQLAIRSQGALLANFTASVTSGRWARNLAAAGKGKWQANAVAKANNYSVGIAAGEGNYATAMQTWLPRIYAAANAVNQMPSGSLSASIARSAAFQTALYNAKRGQ
jgi:hypothetical protein